MINDFSNVKFEILNLFELKNPIFTKLKYYDHFVVKDYDIHFWLGWLYATYRSELASSIIYKYLSNVFSEFTLLSIEESEHAKLLEIILQKVLKKYTKIDYNELEVLYIQQYSKLSSIEQLTIFMVEELSLLVQTALFYKQSNSKTKKDFLKLFLKDESKHINTIFKAFQKTLESATNEDKSKAFYTLIKRAQIRTNFGLPAVSYYIVKNVKNESLQNKILNEVYNNNWHKNHSKILSLRYFKIAQLLNPMSLDQFLSLINRPTISSDKFIDYAIEEMYNNYVEHSVAAV